VEDTVVPRVDQRSAQRYAEHVAGDPREVSDAEGYRPFLTVVCLMMSLFAAGGLKASD
jgi:hypothetical protein